MIIPDGGGPAEGDGPPLTREFALRPATAACQSCEWRAAQRAADTAADVEDAAGQHVTVTGHKVRLVTASEVILGPPPPSPEPPAEERAGDDDSA